MCVGVQEREERREEMVGKANRVFDKHNSWG